MFDVGFSELVLLAIVALVVLGPEKLPHAARIAGAWVGRIRRTVSNMQAEIEREVAAQEIKGKLESEFEEIGGSDLLQELRQERQQIAAGLQATSDEVANSLKDEPVAAPPAQPDSLLADAAKPLETVELDGEKAYREWLETQRQNRIAPPASTNDQSAS
jgi:sec-independent protein translocase protein TatB